MKKSLSMIITLLFLFSAPAHAVECRNWYFVSRSPNARPELPALPQESGLAIGKEDKVLYLTFDAGYENGNVEKIVDILHEKNVPGAFFVLTHFVKANPELVKKMTANGNLVCNHTSFHHNIAALSKEALEEELAGVAREYEAVTGKKMAPFFRPPEGAYSEEALKQVKNAGYRTVFWSLAYKDWDNNAQMSPEKALSILETKVHDGAVILLHPTSQTNAEILGTFIDRMTAKGYRFASLEELA